MDNQQEKILALLGQEDWKEDDIQWLLEYIDRNPDHELQTILQQRFLSRLQASHKGHSDRAAALLKDLHVKMGVSENNIKPVHRIHFLKTTWFRYAAAILIVLGIGAYFRNTQTPPPALVEIPVQAPVPLSVQNDFLPGGNKATLTLADGKIIILDSAANGTIALEGAATIRKKANGEIIYSSGLTGRDEPVVSNTMSTPRGGQYQLTLPDGTKVWLNAASSITYPTAFIGKERTVSVTGELYFEVVKNTKMPFKVKIKDDTEIEVLGTHFNVNAYADEQSIKTTLLEGSVRISKNNHQRILKPGQQAQLTASSISVNYADIDEVMSWKNGLFQFKSLLIEDIMRQISRWYDVDVTYTGKSKGKHFSGIVSRSSPVSEVLKVMDVAGLKFRIEREKISVEQ